MSCRSGLSCWPSLARSSHSTKFTTLTPLTPLTTLVTPLNKSPTRRHASSRSGSSSQWLTRQANDPFVKSRQSSQNTPSTSYVARSAFKLIELHQKLNLLRPGMTVVDLGAAPGGWVQAAHPCLFPAPDKGRRGGRRSRILALDLLPLHKSLEGLDGVQFVQGDFLDPVAQSRLMDLLPGGGGGVDLVLSDMLANLSGNPLRDAQLSLDLCQAALQFALLHLAPGGPAKAVAGGEEGGRGGKKEKAPVRLVMKSLRSGLSPEFESELKEHFTSVNWLKPTSSRPESREGFWVCRGLKQAKPAAS